MITHRCKHCLWWDNEHRSVNDIPIELGKIVPGFCRRRRPGAQRIGRHYYATFPVTDAEEFCGEFKADKET